MQDDAVKTPETPRWFGTGYNADHLTTETGHYVYTPTQSVEDSHRVKHRLEHLEAALREAEAKAALADECYRRWDSDEEVSMHWRNSDTWQAGWLKRYNALQQPKAGQ